MLKRLSAAVVVAAVFASGAAAEPDPKPRLALVSDRPVVIAGSGFRAYERVRLLISPGPSLTRVRAGRLGRFRVGLGFSMPQCGGLVVQALGSRGSRAMIDRSGLDCTSID